jgi:hypothetical protein
MAVSALGDAVLDMSTLKNPLSLNFRIDPGVSRRNAVRSLRDASGSIPATPGLGVFAALDSLLRLFPRCSKSANSDGWDCD